LEGEGVLVWASDFGLEGWVGFGEAGVGGEEFDFLVEDDLDFAGGGDV